MARQISPEHLPAFIAQAKDARILALRDAPERFAEVCSRTNANDRFHFGHTLLQAAGILGRVEAIDFLLKHGADIEAQNNGHWTALLQAAGYGQVEAVDLLIQRGALKEYLTAPNMTAEKLAGERQRYRKLFEQNSNSDFPVIVEALKDPALVEKMVEEMMATLNTPHPERVIHHCHDLETLKLLVDKYRCELNDEDGAGYWPLKSFAEVGDVSAIEYLLMSGADPNFTSTGGIALHTSVQHGTAECVRLLLEHGSNVNQQDVDGWTPLHGVKDLATLDLLLQAGADPRIGDQVGSRPSHWAKDPQIKERLLAAEREWESKE